MSNVEIDQSGRMEMSGDTVVAASDGFTVTVRIKARVKQEVQRKLRERNVKPRLIMIRMFVGAMVLALQEHLTTVGTLTVDEEYTGYEAMIKSLLLDRLCAPDEIFSLGFEFSRDDIRIARIGKSSPAHRAAIRVTRGQVRANKTPTAKELLAVC